ncbi:MAG: dipeptidase PepE [Acidobacteria bacterium]|nr:dipeptidase PepE [Acidobacteriota bacterium]
MRLLLISNSTMAGEAYLEYPKYDIGAFLGPKRITALFLPFAGVTLQWDDYESRVKGRFNEIGHDVISIHRFSDAAKAVNEAEAIVVGGGNTWHLLRCIHDLGLIEALRNKVLSGTKYVGWSAGANVACPTIMTTNDMPIVDPAGFHAFNLVPFQINPHYLDANPEGHAGETREDRIREFIAVNKNVYVVGLREGCMIYVDGPAMYMKGIHSLRLFKYKCDPREIPPGEDLSFLLQAQDG